MDRWARYCHRKENAIGYPRQVLLGKWRDGLPSTRCPICILYEKPKQNCPVCGGDGRVKLETHDNKAIPSMIRGNGRNLTWDDDPVAQKIDWIVCTKLDEDQRVIVVYEFIRSGNRNQKISRLRIRHSTYNEILDSALISVAQNWLDKQVTLTQNSL